MITVNWDIVPYKEAMDRQIAEVETVALGGDDRLVFCTHPAVVTLGRATENSDITSWTGETVEVSRGGRATYHGPNQVVVYPILDLTKERSELRPRDLRAYLEVLGTSIVDALKKFGIQSEYRSLSTGDGPSVTGVWVGEKKIASIGIAVRKWVTYHGIAVNLFEEASAFRGINPCGFSPGIMTSVEAQLGTKVSRAELTLALEDSLRHHLRERAKN